MKSEQHIFYASPRLAVFRAIATGAACLILTWVGLLFKRMASQSPKLALPAGDTKAIWIAAIVLGLFSMIGLVEIAIRSRNPILRLCREGVVYDRFAETSLTIPWGLVFVIPTLILAGNRRSRAAMQLRIPWHELDNAACSEGWTANSVMITTKSLGSLRVPSALLADPAKKVADRIHHLVTDVEQRGRLPQCV